MSLVVRPAFETDVRELPGIERMAATAFQAISDLGWTPGNYFTSVEEHLTSVARGTLWVAVVGGKLVGFLTASLADAELHIDEFNVLPDQQGRGLGRRLVAAAVDSANARGLRAITLTTFREVP